MGEILVTGASGNVGREVVRLLRGEGWRVRAAGRDPARLGAAVASGAVAVPFGFEREETHGAALAGVEAVFLVRPPEMGDGRVFEPFVRAMAGAGVGRVVFLSLQGADRLRVVPHRRIELSLERAGVPWTFLRASFFMQNLSTMLREDIRERGEIAVPAGRGKTGFVDVRDVAAVAVRALTEAGHERRAYELTGGEALGYGAVAEILSGVLGRPIEYTDPSIARFVIGARRRGLALGFVLVMAGIYTTAKLGLADRVTPDVGRLLGRPPTTLRRFAKESAAAWEAEPRR